MARLLSRPSGLFLVGASSLCRAELLPTSIRGSGQSFPYNLAKGAGAPCVATVGLFAEAMPLSEAIGLVSQVGQRSLPLGCCPKLAN
jgi:hypothetical protein